VSFVRSGVVRTARGQCREDGLHGREELLTLGPSRVRDDDAGRQTVEPALLVNIVATCLAWYSISFRVHSPGTITTGDTLPSSPLTGFVTSGHLRPCAALLRDRHRRQWRRGSYRSRHMNVGDEFVLREIGTNLAPP